MLLRHRARARLLLPLAVGAPLFLGCSPEADSAAPKNLATIAGKPVSVRQFEAYLDFKRVPARDEAQMAQAVNDYLTRKALAEAIAASGELDPQAVEAELDEFRKEVLISRYFERHLSKVVTDQSVRAYYDAHVAEFEQPTIHVAHILFRVHRRMSDEERQAKLTAAREAYARVTAGEDFAAVATEMSEDRVSGKVGGDLGWLTMAGVDPQFAKRVFAMKEGGTSEPFESGFGYHVVRAIAGPRTERRPFSAVSGDIRHKLRAKAKRSEMQRLAATVKVERLTTPPPRKTAASTGAAGLPPTHRNPGQTPPAAPDAKAAGVQSR